MFLAPVIVFAGVAGGHHEQVEHQLAPALAKLGITAVALPAADVAQLARHSDHAKEIVAALHVDGLIGGALIKAGGTLTFRVVIYDGQGNMRSLDESSLSAPQLTRDDLEVLTTNLGSEVEELGQRAAKKPKPEVIEAAAIPVEPPTKKPITAPPPKIAEPKFDAPKARPTEVAAFPAEPPKKPAAEIEMADDAPPTETHEAAPKTSADAVSMDEIEAMTGGADTTATASAASEPGETLHLMASGGVALLGRTFTAPAGSQGYTSTPVGGAHFDACVMPTHRTSIDFLAERTLAMTTSLASGNATTAISRWEAVGGLRLLPQVTAILGLGHRAFSIESNDPGRTPDNEYNYVTIGTRLQQPLGEHFTLRGQVAFQPVFGGTDGMEMTLGASTRWGLDLGVGLDARLTKHILARATFDYQHFSWSFDAGTRGADGASDNYPSAMLGLATEL